MTAESASGRDAIIVGKGGHAHVIASFLPHARIRFLVDEDPGPDDLLQSDFLAGDQSPEADYFIGIGDDQARRSWFNRLKARGLGVERCIAPTAWIARDARLGEGMFIGASAVVGARARIGDNVIVNTLASVDHDCEVGDDSQIAPGVTLGGGVRIGRSCFLGMKCAIVPRVTIGDRVLVQAGSLVLRSAPDDVTLSGSPASILRRP